MYVLTSSACWKIHFCAPLQAPRAINKARMNSKLQAQLDGYQLSASYQPPADRLCARCASLNLSVYDFIPGSRPVSTDLGAVRSPATTLSSTSNPRGIPRLPASTRSFGRTSVAESSLLLRSTPSASEQSLPGRFTSYTGHIILSNLPMIYQRRRSCSFCWLLYMATRAPALGRPSGYDNLSNLSCAIEWNLDGRVDGAGSITRRLRVFDPNRQYPDAFIVPLAMKLPGQLEDEQLKPSFLGRIVPKASVNLGLIKRWLDICTRCHLGHCRPPLQENGLAWGQQWIHNFRFIDVHERRLVDTEDLLLRSHQLETLQYATLSYCWGRGVEVKLTKQRLREYTMKLPADSDGMPRTLRDAMDLVRALGLRFIWIDSLCIVQDDPGEWSRVAPLMGELYGHGHINLCAASGHDADHGISGCTGSPRHAVQPMAKCFGVDLMVVRPVEDEIRCTTWDTRAWTFQERILSPRSLIFVEQRVYFQCRQAVFSEDISAECERGQVWNMDIVNSPVYSFGSKIPILHYEEYVRLYSARKLSFLSDRLVAFDGLSGMLSLRLASVFVFGLPLAYFDWALLWETCSDSARINIAPGKFPSWSWCGWDGPTAWRPSMISGTLDHMNTWLTEHTWIKWHVGESSQLPDEPLQDEDASEELWPRRWAGYGLQWSTGRTTSTPDGTALTVDLPCLSPQVSKQNVLHFWSYSAFFRLESSHQPEAAGVELGKGLKRFNIVDSKNDWCGTIVLGKGCQLLADQRITVEFVAISEAKGFTEEELTSWSYYIPQERGQAEWYVYYSLLLKWDFKHTVAERLGLGKIYKAAFANASWDPGMKWREINIR